MVSVVAALVSTGLVLSGVQPAAVATAVEPMAERAEVTAAAPPEAAPAVTIPKVDALSPGTWAIAPPSFVPYVRPAIPNVTYVDNGVPPVQRAFAASPADGAKSVGVTPTLTGAASGTYPTGSTPLEFAYTVCPTTGVAGENSCSRDAKVVAYSGWVKGAWKVPAGKLAANTSYTWEVSVRDNPYIGTMFNEEWWFSTGATSAAYTSVEAELKSPAPQQIFQSLTPTLTGGARHTVSGKTYEYKFDVSLCESATSCGKTTLVANSGWVKTPTWTVPSGALGWNGVYKWTLTVRDNPYIGTLFNPTRTFATMVPTPAGAKLGVGGPETRVAGVGLNDRYYEHVATDAALPSVGAPLAMVRAYSSANTRVGAFGLGWSSLADTALVSSATGKVVRLADGHEVGFGKNPDGKYAPAPGSQGMTLTTCSSPCVAKFVDTAGVTYQFDTTGLASVTNTLGQATTFTRNTAGQITTVKDAASGRSLGLTWSGTKVTKVTLNGAPTGTPNAWTYTYSGDQLTKACRPAAAATCTTYAYAGTPLVLTKVTSPTGGVSANVTYTSGRVSSITTPSGPVSFAAVGITDGKEVTVTSGAAAKDVYQVDARGRTVKLTNSRGGVEQWQYDLLGRTLAYQSPQGGFLRLQYGQTGPLVKREQWYEDGKYARHMYAYHTSGAAAGRLAIATTNQPKVIIGTEPIEQFREAADTELTYDSAGRVSSIIRGPGAGPRTTEKYTYTAGTEAGANGGLMPKGLLRSVTDPAGKTTQFTYTKEGLLASSVNPLGAKTAYTYDWAGRLTSRAVSGTGVTTQTYKYTYNAAGLLETTTQPTTTDAITGDKHTLKQTLSYNASGNITKAVEADTTAGLTRTTTYNLDVFGRVLTETGPDGTVRVQNTYDTLGRLTRASDADGAVTAFGYTAQGDLAKQTLIGYTDGGSAPRDLVLEQATYDRAGRMSTHTDRAGLIHRYTYHADNTLAEVFVKNEPQPDGTAKETLEQGYRYDGEDQLVFAENRGTRTHYAYDLLHRVTGIITETGDKTGPAARQFTRTYDSRGLLTGETVTATKPIRSAKYGYDNGGNLITTTIGNAPDDPNPVTTTIRRDVLGRVLAEVDPRSTAEHPIETQYKWDELNQPVSHTVKSGDKTYTTLTGFDGFGNQTTTRTPAGATTLRNYDAYDRVTKVIDPHEPGVTAAASTWTYTKAGKIASTVDQIGVTTRYTHDPLGQTLAATRSAVGEADRSTTARYDDAGNQTGQTDPLGHTSTATFDRRGNQLTHTTTVDGQPATATFRYDVYGNPTTVTTPEGDVTTTTYNRLHEPTSTTDPAGIVNTLERDSAGRTVRETSSTGTQTLINYDARGNRTRLTHLNAATGAALQSWAWEYNKADLQTKQIDPLGGVRAYSHDARGQLTKLTYEDGATATLGYDDDQNVTSYTDPNGNTTTAKYTPTGWISELTEPETATHPGAADRTYTWEYDAAGRPTRETLPGGTIRTTSYNLDSQPTTETATAGETTTTRAFQYDIAGQLTGYTHPGGTQTIEYDESGHPTASSGPGGESAFAYDRDGNVTSRTDKAGTTTFAWAPGPQLQAVTDPAGKTHTYAYKNGNLTGITRPDVTEAFESDLLGNLTRHSATRGGTPLFDDKYSYDPAGNRTALDSTRPGLGKVAYSYDIRNRLTGWTDKAGEHTAAWDAAGNLTGLDGQKSEYDQRNRLIRTGDTEYAYSPDGNQTTARDQTLTYDGFGQLTSDGTTDYQYDALGRLTTSGTEQHTYAGLAPDATTIGGTGYVRDANGRLLTTTGGRAFSDARGDIIGQLDPAGTFTATTYTPFGTPTPAASGGPGYQSDYTAPTTGLVNMGARWYQPATGNFLTRDTANLPIDEQNRYAYSLGNPLTYNDPTGHWAFALPALGAVGAGLLAVGGGALAIGAALSPDRRLGAQLQEASTQTFATAKSLTSAFNISIKLPTHSTSFNATRTNVRAATLSVPRIPARASVSAPATSWRMPRVSVDMPNMNFSIPDFNLNLPSFKYNIPKLHYDFSELHATLAGIENLKFGDFGNFGIDLPGWDYPEPYLAKGIMPVGIAAAGTAIMCGTKTSDACRAATWANGASCITSAGATLGGCAPPITTGIWANEPAPGAATDAPLSHRPNPGGPNTGCEPGEIPTDQGCEDPLSLLDRVLEQWRDGASNSDSGADSDTPGSHSYLDITDRKSTVRNVKTSTTVGEFTDTLLRNGWIMHKVTKADVWNFTRDGAKYSVRNKATGWPGWTADFHPRGAAREKPAVKIRLGDGE